VPIEKKESVRWLGNLRQSFSLLGSPERCVHVSDRESDIYGLYCLTQELGAHFLARMCVDRLAGDGSHTISAEVEDVRVKGLHHVEFRDEMGDVTRAALELKFKRIILQPLKRSQSFVVWSSLPDKASSPMLRNRNGVNFVGMTWETGHLLTTDEIPKLESGLRAR